MKLSNLKMIDGEDESIMGKKRMTVKEIEIAQYYFRCYETEQIRFKCY